MRAFKTILVFLALMTMVVLLGIGTAVAVRAERENRRQEQLQGFYGTPASLPTEAGTLLRHEPLTGKFDLPGGHGHRIMYVTESGDGTSRVASGMIFIPDAPATGMRKVISWAHPTVGMGDACAPSRSRTPTGLLDWLPGMMARGWVVVATDYAGLGTEGVQEYLIGQSEVRDVVNAVRAARQFPGAMAGRQYGVFGHSQGGHAALWAGTLAPDYAPELTLVGVAGAAPAAPLADLVSQEWDSNVAWVIGAEVFVSFPAVYPGLSREAVGTPTAVRTYDSVANRCLIDGILEGELRTELGQRFFASDPLSAPGWRESITDQSAPPTAPGMPVLVTESVNDGVVLPSSIATMQKQWCQSGSDLQVTWLGPLRGTALKDAVMSHMYEGSVGGAVATTWFERLFDGERPGPRTCRQTPPLPVEAG